MSHRVTTEGALVAHVNDESPHRVTTEGALVAHVHDASPYRVTTEGLLIAYLPGIAAQPRIIQPIVIGY